MFMKINSKNMKSIFITFDQAYQHRIIDALDKHNCRGFTYFEQVQGRGTTTGEPHYGSHAWPSMCSAIITIVEDHRVKPILDQLRQMDEATPMLGLRAFVWNIEDGM
jgi:nitrogen regulatory protein PII